MDERVGVDEALDRLALEIRDRRVAVLCGAGISREAGLPVVSELLPAVLRGIGATEREVCTLTGAALPFEAFMQVFCHRSDWDPLLDIFALGEPGTAHHFLAKLMRLGALRTIGTTNFDELQEAALRLEGLQPGTKYCIAHDETSWSCPQDSSAATIIKLHGTVGDRCSMATTIASVAAKRASAWRSDAVARIFGDAPIEPSGAGTSQPGVVLVLGYSFSDVFDLMPAMQAIPLARRKRLVVLRHSSAGSLTVQDLDGSELPQLRNYHGHLLDGDTAVVVRGLWNRLLDDPYEPRTSEARWRDNVRAWSSRHSPATCLGILGKLLAMVSQFRAAQDRYEGALACLGTDTPHERAQVLLDLAEALRSIGRFTESAAAAREALTLAAIDGRSGALVRAHMELGASLQAPGDHRGAIAEYERGLAAMGPAADRFETSQMLGRMAVSYRHMGDLSRAKECYRMATATAADAGDKWSELAHLVNLGACHRENDESGLALRVLKRAVELASQLGDRHAEMLCRGNLANCLHDEGKALEAIAQYEVVADAARDFDDVRTLQTALNDLGRAHVDEGQVTQGISLLERALGMARSTSDAEGESIVLGHLAGVYAGTREYSKAASLYEEAAEIADGLGAHLRQAMLLGALADVHGCLGRRDLSATLNRKALRLLEPLLGTTHPKVLQVQRRLESDGRPNTDGTPLLAAARAGDGKRVTQLLDGGADPNARNADEKTALHVATIEGHPTVVQSCLACGGDPNVADRIGWYPLHLAAKLRRADIAALLLAKGASPKVANREGASPLHLAAANGDGKILALLLRSGADVEARDGNGALPIHDAVESGNCACVETLLEAGANVNTANGVGWCPIHIAARHGLDRILELLIQRGADLAAVTRKGSSAEMLATHHGHDAIALRLALHVAKPKIPFRRT